MGGEAVENFLAWCYDRRGKPPTRVFAPLPPSQVSIKLSSSIPRSDRADQRFLRMVNGKSSLNRTVTFADPPTSSRYVSTEVPADTLNAEIIDAAYVWAIDPQNYPGGQEAMSRELRLGDAVPLGRHWSYKYLVDLDGMSYSGRFMSFLASDSAPIKATIYQEYFTDWIQPWCV